MAIPGHAQRFWDIFDAKFQSGAVGQEPIFPSHEEHVQIYPRHRLWSHKGYQQVYLVRPKPDFDNPEPKTWHIQGRKAVIIWPKAGREIVMHEGPQAVYMRQSRPYIASRRPLPGEDWGRQIRLRSSLILASLEAGSAAKRVNAFLARVENSYPVPAERLEHIGQWIGTALFDPWGLFGDEAE